MRFTEVTPRQLQKSTMTQQQLDTMWLLIENNYAEDWRVERNGAVVLEVGSDKLIAILGDNYEVAVDAFGAFEQHNPEFESYEWVNLPEHLCGTYIIRGIYSGHGVLIQNGKRRYQFIQEGF